MSVSRSNLPAIVASSMRMNDWFGFGAYVRNHIVEHAVDEIGIWIFAYSPRDQHSIEAVYCRRQIYFACRNSKLTDTRQKKFVWFLAMKIPLYFVWNSRTDFPLYELYFLAFGFYFKTIFLHHSANDFLRDFYPCLF